MRYKLKRNKNGMITQCETNADGGNIYAQREEINKIALENLKREQPGKLGDLSNMQIFNCLLDPNFTNTSSDTVYQQYNTLVTTGNVTDCIMFNVNSINNKASYYNIIDIKASVQRNDGDKLNITDDSYIEFYLLENIETSTSSLGRKIPRRAPINGTTSGTIAWSTTGAKQEYQSIKVDAVSDSINIPSRLQGLRASGLALKTIDLNFSDLEDTTKIRIGFQIFVDVTSVSNSY